MHARLDSECALIRHTYTSTAHHCSVDTHHCRMSKPHPGRACLPCLLCGKSAVRNTHFNQWSLGMKSFARTHYGRNIPDNSCICRADYLDAKKHRSNPEYIPKWSEKQHTNQTRKCSYLTCDVNGGRLIKPSFIDADTIMEVIDTTQPILLCPAHYTVLHKTIASKQTPCASCNNLPTSGASFFRHSPDPATVNRKLQQNPLDGISDTITAADCLCMSCYKLHLSMCKQAQKDDKDNSTLCTQDIQVMGFIVHGVLI